MEREHASIVGAGVTWGGGDPARCAKRHLAPRLHLPRPSKCSHSRAERGSAAALAAAGLTPLCGSARVRRRWWAGAVPAAVPSARWSATAPKCAG
jgi:hypothetical protein